MGTWGVGPLDDDLASDFFEGLKPTEVAKLSDTFKYGEVREARAAAHALVTWNKEEKSFPLSQELKDLALEALKGALTPDEISSWDDLADAYEAAVKDQIAQVKKLVAKPVTSTETKTKAKTEKWVLPKKTISYTSFGPPWVTVPVSDLGKSEIFYRDFFDAKVLQKETKSFILLLGGGVFNQIYVMKEFKPATLKRTLSGEFKEDLIKRLKSSGARHEVSPSGKFINVEDLDGHIWIFDFYGD